MIVAVRALASIFALICVVAANGDASAQTYPARPVRLVVPFGAGGPTDVIARIVAQKLSEAWGQQVYTENIATADIYRQRAPLIWRKCQIAPCFLTFYKKFGRYLSTQADNTL